MCPLASLALPRPFPLYAAFPRSEYPMGESDFHHRVRFPMDGPSGRRTQLNSRSAKTMVDLSGPSMLPFPSVPCSQTPPQSPAPSPLREPTVAFQVFRPCRPADYRVTRLNRFTCVTARSSLCLRLTHLVTSMSPRLDSRWGGSFPLPRRELHPLEASGFS